MEISENKSAAMLLARYYSIQKLWELSNDILSIHVTKRAINQQEIKFGGLKNIWNFQSNLTVQKMKTTYLDGVVFWMVILDLLCKCCYALDKELYIQKLHGLSSELLCIHVAHVTAGRQGESPK